MHSISKAFVRHSKKIVKKEVQGIEIQDFSQDCKINFQCQSLLAECYLCYIKEWKLIFIGYQGLCAW